MICVPRMVVCPHYISGKFIFSWTLFLSIVRDYMAAASEKLAAFSIYQCFLCKKEMWFLNNYRTFWISKWHKISIPSGPKLLKTTFQWIFYPCCHLPYKLLQVKVKLANMCFCNSLTQPRCFPFTYLNFVAFDHLNRGNYDKFFFWYFLI